ncbi:hypothetical protein DITRI_Ditri12bG0021000 [Diplodiscus trichospermus]
MEGPNPILTLIHAVIMVADGIFLITCLLPLFRVIHYIMNLISLIIVLLGVTLALAQKDIKRGLAYSTMSQLGYMMLALGMGSYRVTLFSFDYYSCLFEGIVFFRIRINYSFHGSYCWILQIKVKIWFLRVV